MPDETRLPALHAPNQVEDVLSLAQQMAASYAKLVTLHTKQLGKTPAEAEAWAREAAEDAELRAEILDKPGPHMTWWELSRLMEHDPGLFDACWARIRGEARAELASGARAGAVLEHNTSPWDRARFLAILVALTEEWQPRGGLERTLIDTLAQAHTAYLFWLGELQRRALTESRREERQVQLEGSWQAPRVEAVAAQEQAAAMVDRFNRLFLRTLRALRDLRRYTPGVVVQHAGQVNVGGQQVNVSATDHAAPG